MSPNSYKYEDVFTSSAGYAARFSGSVGEYLIAQQTTAIKKVLEGHEDSLQRICDVGGAHGQLIEIASGLGRQLVVISSHSDAFDNLALRVSGRKDFIPLVGDILNLPIGDRSFDLVTSVRLISHVDSWKELVRELCRASSQFVLIDYPPLVSSNLLYRVLFPLKKLLEGNTRTFTIFKHRELNEEFALNGFECCGRSSQFFWPMVFHRKLKNVGLSRAIELVARILGLTHLLGNPSIALYRRK